ncbi:MAG: hypothetical protein SFW67_12875 [Myxococcaceae bacterium]|nr:hypothetical protein [Myxococcaceae bacterium]
MSRPPTSSCAKTVASFAWSAALPAQSFRADSLGVCRTSSFVDAS